MTWVDLDLFIWRQTQENANSYGFVDSFKDFCPKNFNDDLSWPWNFYGKVKFAFLAFILQEFMELVEEFCAKVNDTVK